MIQILLCDPSFQYDVHSLVKAFYPAEDVCITGISESAFDNCIEIRETEDEICCLKIENGSVTAKSHAAIAGMDRKDVKSTLKRILYNLLKEITGICLPWGTLTGIRPTKLAMSALLEGRSGEEIVGMMQDFYLVSAQKADLAYRIAKLEQRILKPLHQSDGFSLYIGIPFCPTTCMYCSFTSYPIGKYEGVVDTYLSLLEQEMEQASQVFAGRILDTVYIGGGTPTTLSPDQMRRLNEALRKHFDFQNVVEYTMEAGRPDSITKEKLAAMKEIGIDRLSVNPQTMHDETLRIIGRRHTVAQTVEAFQLAREAGFCNINTDLILGLPGEDERMVEETFDRIRELSPDSLTVHSMAIKRAAAMHAFLDDHPELESQNTPEMMEIGMRCASDMQMQPYYLYRQKNMAGNFENVGYAKEGKYGLYNILIMEEVQSVAAIGAGVISKTVHGDGLIERCANVKDVGLYLSAFDQVMQKKRMFYDRGI